MIRRRAIGVALILLLGGCNLSLTDTQLPGGPDVGDHPLHVTFESADTLNLVKQATVKVDDVTVGVVDDIQRVGWHAQVSLLIRSDVHLPANSTVSVRQTGLLGEKYVALAAPSGAPSVGDLVDGSHIDLDHSTRGIEIEEARCPCCSTAVASTDSRPSPASCTRLSTVARATSVPTCRS